jgi:hypothetical protein
MGLEPRLTCGDASASSRGVDDRSSLRLGMANAQSIQDLSRLATLPVNA